MPKADEQRDLSRDSLHRWRCLQQHQHDDGRCLRLLSDLLRPRGRQDRENYDKQISAAGNNSAKKKRLEAKRDKEVAAAKSKANKKAMKIEIAQAIASTAMAAINAYSSAAAIPVVGHILGPIAAGLATAAGMLQIATIKSSTRQRRLAITRVVSLVLAITRKRLAWFTLASSSPTTTPSTILSSSLPCSSSIWRSATTLSPRSPHKT